MYVCVCTLFVIYTHLVMHYFQIQTDVCTFRYGFHCEYICVIILHTYLYKKKRRWKIESIAEKILKIIRTVLTQNHSVFYKCT